MVLIRSSSTLGKRGKEKKAKKLFSVTVCWCSCMVCIESRDTGIQTTPGIRAPPLEFRAIDGILSTADNVSME